MYACKIYFSNSSEKREIENLLNTNLIRSYILEEDVIVVRTRKIWKLYYLNRRFKKYKHDFYYSKFAKYGIMRSIPSSLDNFEINIVGTSWIDPKFIISFQNINDVLKIRILSFFLK